LNGLIEGMAGDRSSACASSTSIWRCFVTIRSELNLFLTILGSFHPDQFSQFSWSKNSQPGELDTPTKDEPVRLINLTVCAEAKTTG
jgi:hypothetical protein